MKKLPTFFVLLALFTISNVNAQSSSKTIIQKYFDALNASNFNKVEECLSDDFIMIDGDFTLCTNASQFYTVFQWDSVFSPNYVVNEIKELEGYHHIKVTKNDDRVRLLHDTPMITTLRIKVEDERIKQIKVLSYDGFDFKKWQGRLNGIKSYIDQFHSELSGFERDISLNGALKYKSAISYYANRDLRKDEKIFIDKQLKLIHLKDSVFVHVSKYPFGGGKPYPSNGLIVVKNGKAIMIDTPPDNGRTERLYLYLKDKMNIEVTHLIPGHFHIDCMGGIDFLHKEGVHSIANKMTIDKCITIGITPPKESFVDSKKLNFNGLNIELRFLGGAHSFDNIIVWMPDSKVLFGGCMVKDVRAQGMGNLSDATVEEWDGTVEKIQKSYPQAEIVIPGHGAYGGQELLTHTIELVKNYKSNNGAQ